MSQQLDPRIAVVGVGLVGKRHAQIAASRNALTAIADPSASARDLAHDLGVPVYDEVAALLAAQDPDGIIVATPNQRHEEDGLACIEAGKPVLIEKPLAGDLAGAENLVGLARQHSVPLLVGHHRRYNPKIAAAKKQIQSGALGRIVAVNATCWLYKPDSYFDPSWRRSPGAGPVFINLIHDIDLIRHLCGEIVSVQAIESAAIRGFDVEDTAGALLHFANGAIGTMTVSDTIVAPWSWELTAAENPVYPATGAFSYAIGGTRGSLSVPDMTYWTNRGTPGWHEPLESVPLEAAAADPLERQMDHFADVVTGRSPPWVSGLDGLMALRVVAAIKDAACSGVSVDIPQR
ncbi:MAG: Gfo/Idh/MocA family oxidoreductase [Pseudomonadota bacterium]